MPDRTIERAAVIGAGTMGSGIAQVFAQFGIDVVVIDVEDRFLERGASIINGNWNRSVEKGRISEEQVTAANARLTFATDRAAVAGADIVVEAIIEDPGAKAELFRDLDARCRPDTILASNTSSISITSIAASAGSPARVIGMHFFNPVPVMQLVEVVRGERTDDATVAATVALATRVGKSPVEVNDFPGFVSNRILIPMINEAVFCLGEGVATRDAIDTVMKLGMAHPMGPLTLADLIGLDVCLHILEILHRDFGDDKYRPAPLLKRMVAAGKLGRKTGEGFYTYDR